MKIRREEFSYPKMLGTTPISLPNKILQLQIPSFSDAHKMAA